MKKFKKIFVVSCAIVMALTFTGCTKKEVYTIEPHETAFLISLSEGGGKQASFESEAMLAEANKIISESLTDRLIQQQMYEKWDGKLPTYVGGDASIPVLNDMK